MRELMLSGYDWAQIGTALLVIAALGAVALPLTARNYRRVYGCAIAAAVDRPRGVL
jgi:hypothetical protein